jgi:hypothetical protein
METLQQDIEQNDLEVHIMQSVITQLEKKDEEDGDAKIHTVDVEEDKTNSSTQPVEKLPADDASTDRTGNAELQVSDSVDNLPHISSSENETIACTKTEDESGCLEEALAPSNSSISSQAVEDIQPVVDDALVAIEISENISHPEEGNEEPAAVSQSDSVLSPEFSPHFVPDEIVESARETGDASEEGSHSEVAGGIADDSSGQEEESRESSAVEVVSVAEENTADEVKVPPSPAFEESLVETPSPASEDPANTGANDATSQTGFLKGSIISMIADLILPDTSGDAETEAPTSSTDSDPPTDVVTEVDLVPDMIVVLDADDQPDLESIEVTRTKAEAHKDGDITVDDADRLLGESKPLSEGNEDGDSFDPYSPGTGKNNTQSETSITTTSQDSADLLLVADSVPDSGVRESATDGASGGYSEPRLPENAVDQASLYSIVKKDERCDNMVSNVTEGNDSAPLTSDIPTESIFDDVVQAELDHCKSNETCELKNISKTEKADDDNQREDFSLGNVQQPEHSMSSSESAILGNTKADLPADSLLSGAGQKASIESSPLDQVSEKNGLGNSTAAGNLLSDSLQTPSFSVPLAAALNLTYVKVKPINTSCLDSLKYSDFHAKMWAKLEAPSADGNSTNVPISSQHSSSTPQDSIFKPLISKIKKMEIKNMINEMYTSQLGDCYRLILTELQSSWGPQGSIAGVAVELIAALDNAVDSVNARAAVALETMTNSSAQIEQHERLLQSILNTTLNSSSSTSSAAFRTSKNLESACMINPKGCQYSSSPASAQISLFANFINVMQEVSSSIPV